jgi:hypothetical protein
VADLVAELGGTAITGDGAHVDAGSPPRRGR